MLTTNKLDKTCNASLEQGTFAKSSRHFGHDPVHSVFIHFQCSKNPELFGPMSHLNGGDIRQCPLETGESQPEAYDTLNVDTSSILYCIPEYRRYLQILSPPYA